MKGSIIYLLFLLLPGPGSFLQAQQIVPVFDKPSYYKVLQDGTIEAVDKQILQLETNSNASKDAYLGALLMKKAGLIKGASKKLHVFKDGNKRLESVIKKDNENPEWHFLRLIIQEHAPKILNYHSDINKDALIVHGAFKKLSPELQSVVIDYRKHSNTLQPLNF